MDPQSEYKIEESNAKNKYKKNSFSNGTRLQGTYEINYCDGCTLLQKILLTKFLVTRQTAFVSNISSFLNKLYHWIILKWFPNLIKYLQISKVHVISGDNTPKEHVESFTSSSTLLDLHIIYFSMILVFSKQFFFFFNSYLMQVLASKSSRVLTKISKDEEFKLKNPEIQN